MLYPRFSGTNICLGVNFWVRQLKSLNILNKEVVAWGLDLQMFCDPLKGILPHTISCHVYSMILFYNILLYKAHVIQGNSFKKLCKLAVKLCYSNCFFYKWSFIESFVVVIFICRSMKVKSLVLKAVQYLRQFFGCFCNQTCNIIKADKCSVIKEDYEVKPVQTEH